MDNDKTLLSTTPPGTLHPGTVINGRFSIEHLAGRGGMGHVYRAQDNASGQPVALKLLHGALSPELIYRFNREAALLEGLHHPGIVAYMACGTTESGQPFLAMEWLEGEDLSRRLARQPLSLLETLTLVRRAAEALSQTHRQGIVHRDIKPSNLFLRSGSPEDVVLLDFGLARHAEPSLMRVTGSHTIVGTPGYMAPEQASSQPEIPPAADIFSLGCVLYECLTGTPPFAAPHFAAALAKILFAEPAPLHSLRPGLPMGLQSLVDRMLAKAPQRRLPDANALLVALATLESAPELLLTHPQEQVRPQGLAGAEQKLVSVLLVSLETMAHEPEATVDWSQGKTLRDTLRATLAPFGTQVELLADGSLVVTLVPERGTATDQAAMAARCALMIRDRWPQARVVLVTGRAVRNAQLPLGEAMDRAGHLLRRVDQMPGASQVLMDEVTAGLLGPDFQLSRTESGTYLLQGEQLGADASRPLMGKPTPCVGREQELALLDFTLSSCIEEPTARAVLVTAPAGVGKSRLRHEFLRRVERREQPVLVLVGRGFAMSTGAAYGLLGQALRGLCGIVDSESLEARRSRLSQRVALHLPPASAQEVVEFLGELCAVPFPDDASPRLRTARGDPQLMSAQMGRALVSFFKAECAQQPVLLVLEDLHWGDALTVKLVEVVLRELTEQPLLVLALAQPELKELFPSLWSRHVQELALGGLNRKASIRLVRAVLGVQESEPVVQRAVEQAGGNALLLEELIRWIAEGRGEAVPETVLAVLQARLMRMEPSTRQVLLAASFFGTTFWSEGVRELLELQPDTMKRHLRQLVEQEVIAQQPTSRFITIDEYHFRHALVRDAAYALLSDSYLPTGHRLVGAWLEQMGETDALVLATHAQRGQQPEHAVRFYARAAEQLFKQHALAGALRCIEAALACGASNEGRTRLLAFQAVVFVWLNQMPRALEVGSPVLRELRAGSLPWCRLIGTIITGHLFGGRQAQVTPLIETFLSTQPEPDAINNYAQICVFLGGVGAWNGDRQWMTKLMDQFTRVVGTEVVNSPLMRGFSMMVNFQRLHHFETRPWQAFQAAEVAARDVDISDIWHFAILSQVDLGRTLVALGDVTGALELLRKAYAAAQRAGQPFFTSLIQHELHMALAGSSEPSHLQEAHSLALELMRSEELDPIRKGLDQLSLARLSNARGEKEKAELHARRACELLAPLRVKLSRARQLLSTVLLAQGDAVEAQEVAILGVQEMEQRGRLGCDAVAMYLALAEACFAAGDSDMGENTLRKALQCVHARASDIPDPTLRERFLRQVPENARTLQLARQRGSDVLT